MLETFTEIYPYIKPVIDFTHSTAWGIFLCVGWFLTYLFMSMSNKKMREQCNALLLKISKNKNNNSNSVENEKEC